MFDINKFRNLVGTQDRYKTHIESLQSRGMVTQNIERTVDDALNNLKDGTNSFVIYGEPQSGKTEMMIALTAKLLDIGYKIIIVLLKDDIQILNQNIERFRRSRIDPTARYLEEILEEDIGDKKWIIFCKKNNKNLKTLIDKLYNRKEKVIIDDEADYASPNAKINRQLRTAINKSICELLGEEGIYIGVTATPARLDLNNTLNNISEKWVYFKPHNYYVGKDVFFPMDPSGQQLKYSLEFLPDKGDDPKHLEKAILSFLVNVAYININEDIRNSLKRDEKSEINFCLLIHTSGEILGHERDKKIAMKLFDALSDEESKSHDRFVQRLYDIAVRKYGSQTAEETVRFVLKNIYRNIVDVMNYKKPTKTDPTNPPSLFTVAIGGNIVSRGVTFRNLLGMFFTRDVKDRMQQDTYIQRARMFGNRLGYLSFFELWIPETLYLDWHKCFVYHYLSLEGIKTGKGAPIWISDDRVKPAASSSIDKRYVFSDSGEMYFGKFEYAGVLDDILNSRSIDLEKLEMINSNLGEEVFPQYLISFIKFHVQPYEGYIAIHKVRNVGKDTKDPEYHDDLKRKKGVIGGEDEKRFPNALHHIMILRNTRNEARIVYKYVGKAQFLKNLKRNNV